MFANLRELSQSLAFKFVVLLFIFMAVPLILYERFRAVDEEKNLLLVRSMQEEGRLIAVGMAPLLATFETKTANNAKDTFSKMSSGRGNVKLLFRPKSETDAGAFFYIAAAPPAPAEYLSLEMAEMVKTGILDVLRDTCQGDRPLSTRYKNPAGNDEILTSITPLNLENGCWAVITSNSKAEFVNSSFAQPYWKTAEVRFAAAIYLLMAVVVIVLFAGVWRSLRRFEKLARKIRVDGAEEMSFAAQNRIPELTTVAQEFDRLVSALHSSARSIRQAAEENAHALKAPLAVIAQSVEPLKRALGGQDERPRRALELIERSVNRLDALVSAARRMDEAAAELMDTPRRKIDFSALLRDALEACAEWPSAHGLTLAQNIEPRVTVWGGDDMIEVLVENILDNAIGFSPPGGTIAVSLRRNGRFAEFVIEDEGSGVAPENLERIFERYYSERPSGPDGEGDHFGIGLWIVRRNVEALGGRVTASARESGGLQVKVELRLAA